LGAGLAGRQPLPFTVPLGVFCLLLALGCILLWFSASSSLALLILLPAPLAAQLAAIGSASRRWPALLAWSLIPSVLAVLAAHVMASSGPVF
jgi:hypothetical protein